MATEKLKRHKSPGIDQIPAKMIKAGGRKIRSKIHKPINYIWNKEELPEWWEESIMLPIYGKGNRTDCSKFLRHINSVNYTQNINQHPAIKVNSICRGIY